MSLFFFLSLFQLLKRISGIIWRKACERKRVSCMLCATCVPSCVRIFVHFHHLMWWKNMANSQRRKPNHQFVVWGVVWLLCSCIKTKNEYVAILYRLMVWHECEWICKHFHSVLQFCGERIVEKCVRVKHWNGESSEANVFGYWYRSIYVTIEFCPRVGDKF